MATPKLRFKEFNGDWSYVRLKDLVVSLDAGVSVNGEDVDVTEDDFSVLKTSCVSLGTFNVNERKKVTLEHEIQRLKEPLLDNSLVMNRSNTPLLVGASAFIKRAPKKTYLSDKLWQFKVNQNANIQWIAFYLSNETTLIRLRDMATGTSNSMKNITKPDVLNMEFFAPNKEEQTKIASFLSNVDEKISQLTQKCELLSQYKQGMMQKLFSQQIRFKADDGSEFEEWRETTVGAITKTISAGATPSTLKEEYWGGDIKWMSSGELNYKHVYDVEKTITELGFKSSSTKLLPKYCVLIGLAGQGKTRGTVAINYIGLCTNQSIAAIHPNPNVFDHRFIFFNLDMRYQELRGLSTGDGGRGGLNLQIIKGVELKLPCLQEQTKIANFLSAIDQKIAVVAQQIEQAKQWKKGLLQQMFV